jgi:hypothetical protein
MAVCFLGGVFSLVGLALMAHEGNVTSPTGTLTVEVGTHVSAAASCSDEAGTHDLHWCPPVLWWVILATPPDSEDSIGTDGGISVSGDTVCPGAYPLVAKCDDTYGTTADLNVVAVDTVDTYPHCPFGTKTAYKGTDITFEAVSIPSGYESMISWLGGGDPATGSGKYFTTHWHSTGTKTVTARCGTPTAVWDKTINVTVVEVEYVKVRRMGSGNSLANSATIAAGGFSSNVHKADVEMKITPVPSGTYAVACPVSLANADGYATDNVKAKLYMGGALAIEGSGSGSVTVSSADGKLAGYLVSSNWMKTCTISGGSASAAVDFAWDCAGAYDFTLPEYFIPDVPDEVWFYPTLNEVMGDGAIDAYHSIPYYTLSADLYWYSYDFSTDSEADGTVTVYYPSYTGIPFGKAMTDLIEHSATTMSASGAYQNTQTVYDYYDIVGDEFRLIEVDGYTFAVYDEDVHL